METALLLVFVIPCPIKLNIWGYNWVGNYYVDNVEKITSLKDYYEEHFEEDKKKWAIQEEKEAIKDKLNKEFNENYIS